MSDAPRQVRLLKRYWPFLGLIGIQLVLAGVAPSTGHSLLSGSGQVSPGTIIQPDSNAAAAAGSVATNGAGTAPVSSGSVADGTPTSGTASVAPGPGVLSGPGNTATGPATGTTAGNAPGPAAVSGTVKTGGGTPRPGSTKSKGSTPTGTKSNSPTGTTTVPNGAAASKCAPGGALQQNVTSQSPPCLAPIPMAQNGGATATGVTATSITVVLYQAKVNPAVNSVEAGAGLAEDPAAQAVAATAFTNFFNQHYELAGRQIVIKTFAGTCTVDPPDDSCLRSDADTIVSTLKPFWVLWPTGRPSFFQELSKMGVLNSGGLTFSGSFNRANAPYHYSAFTSGDRMAASVAAYWCNRLLGKPASLAGDATLRTQTRKLGILVREEPANEAAADSLASLVSGGPGSLCNGPKPVIITFSQDITTAQEQSSTAIAKLKQAGVTTVASISSALELVLQMNGFATNAYYPENLLVGTGLVDVDAAGRLVNSQEWADAFGLGDEPVGVPDSDADATKAFDAGGQTGVPYAQAAITFQEMQLMVWQLQAAAGHLDAVDVARATFSMQVIGDYDGDGHNARAVRWQVTNNDYSGPDDGRQIYWDANATSTSDGKTGAYVNVDSGHRYVDGVFPAGEPKKP